MIIFGLKFRSSAIWQGWFFCPFDQAIRSATLEEGRNWFVLFFVIPVFPTGSKRRFVECGDCGRQYAEGVLQRQVQPPPGQPAAPPPPAPLTA